MYIRAGIVITIIIIITTQIVQLKKKNSMFIYVVYRSGWCPKHYEWENITWVLYKLLLRNRDVLYTPEPQLSILKSASLHPFIAVCGIYPRSDSFSLNIFKRCYNEEKVTWQWEKIRSHNRNHHKWIPAPSLGQRRQYFPKLHRPQKHVGEKKGKNISKAGYRWSKSVPV